MPARKIEGIRLAKVIKAEIALEVARRVADGKHPPGLAAVLVGENPASQVYVRNKRKACEEAGLNSWLHHLPADTTQEELLKLVHTLNQDPKVNGILVQLPLPKHIDEETILRAVTPLKDVDSFHPENVGLLMTGHPRFMPCTPFGVLQMLKRSDIETAGKRVVILGRSNIVGKPLALMMMQKPSDANPHAGDATVTVAHRGTKHLKEICQQAEILIAAIGVPNFVTAQMVQPGAVVIDVGINSVNGKLCGDVDPEVGEVAAALSPVPGGVGPMTIAMLLQNTLKAATIHQT
ncbi:bifunctional methylenetetrahydrofolate dehydrogenase/methenyltetrahydrofolate cyclohydrolase FolD [Telmatocola sphagniphila]|uniref:Bifunctional protein FolD n=1 Tax=Telmatocola sphagniphila TaxID=1123043 RepID=A0A8E6B818_9BACT|nr:bifunctional methylenetetrahydrofolate dehydrogenase/methenyltetrahydrofolate cyclohydrolase FolD [Telmatocola sphagniphila]QVL32253.1 bifunctional methylenetetrahydrofolate dehydrogenase/methenyltetrahydrofolate cyclohydrolase FolD [Telmatocola sphagniphila]